MMRRLLILLMLLSGLTSCVRNNHQQSVKLTKDTLTYHFKQTQQLLSGCKRPADSGCRVFVVRYPEFDKAPALNDTIRLTIADLFYGRERADTTMDAVGKRFKYMYEHYEFPIVKEPTISPQLHAQTFVVKQDSGLTKLQMHGFVFASGSKGFYFTRLINWDTRTGKQLQLKDILIDGYEPELNLIAEQLFRKQEKIADTVDLNKSYILPLQSEKFEINNNFLIMPKGLVFEYDEMQLKPWQPVVLTIPYSKITKLLRPNTVVAQYIK